MSVYVLVEGTLKEGEVDAFTELCREAFPTTRSYEGCQNIHLTYNVDEPRNFILNQTWDSKEHYQAYLDFRVKDGTVEKIQSLSDGDLSIRIFDIADV